jgi:hypothetical protein
MMLCARPQVWRVVTMQLQAWDAELHGRFYEDDCYIVLATSL